MGSAVCHQMAERSFIVEGMQMPFCARCTGIYIGAFFAFCYFFLKKRMYGNTFTLTQAVITGMMILPIGIDGTGSYLGFWESSQGMRIFTGSLVGAVTPGFLLMAGNFEPQKENESLVYEDTMNLLFLMVISVGYGVCLMAGIPAYGISALMCVLGEGMLWGGAVWLILKNLLKKKGFPYWKVSVGIAFVVLFLMGGLV